MNSFNISNQRNSDSRSSSPSPSNCSRSREKEREKEINENNNNPKNNFQIEGKLYLSNIPLSFPQSKIVEEFEKFGRILDFSFRKKTDTANPYYYGYIILNGKIEAEKAIENLTKLYNWTIMPFNKETKEKNKRDKKLNKHINIKSFLNKKINIPEDNISYNSQNINLNNKLSINLNNNVRVREIWVTNLPLSTNESQLYKHFFIYGEISKIELKTFFDKKNAFIKYRLMHSALKALEKENNAYFNGNIISISFSNESKRKDIAGNEPGYELKENNCKLIVACLNKNLEVAKDKTILAIFENYGKIKNMTVKNISNCNYIFVEFYKYEDAQNAVFEINKEINSDKRRMLGDENCEIEFYFRNKHNEINPFLNEENNFINMNTHQNNFNVNNFNEMNGMNSTPIFQFLQKMFSNNSCNINYNNTNNIFPNKNLINNQFNWPQNTQNKINNNNFNMINNINNQNKNNLLNNLNLSNNLNNLINCNSLQSKPKLPFPLIGQQLFSNLQGFNLPQNFPAFQSPNQNNLSLSLLLNNPCFSNIVNNNFKNQINLNANIEKCKNFQNNNIQNNNTQSNEVKDLLNKIMLDKNNKKSNINNDSDVSSLNSEEMDFEKEYSLEEENLKYIWNGILTKNKKEKVNIDIFKIRGKIDDNNFKGYHLNICNRIQYEEVLKKHLLGIVAISPQNITQKEIFDNYLDYFTTRQRCGVINLSEKYTLFIASPGEFSKKFYINPKKHLLGLLVGANVEPNLYADKNNLALPPPVISLSERRRIMKKNESKKYNNNIIDNDENNDKKNELDMFIKLKEKFIKNDINEINKEDNNKNMDELINKNPNIQKLIDRLTKKVS